MFVTLITPTSYSASVRGSGPIVRCVGQLFVFDLLWRS